MTKRIFDLIVALILLAVLSPVLLITAIAVLVSMGRPVLFAQSRVGLNGRIFRIFKFRTMHIGPANSDDATRMTAIGGWLRRTSLDELPELLNVIRGEMSLVGPRPLLVEYLPLYNEEQMRRHDVRPGLTGWAQVNGRNAISWEEKFRLDVWYVDYRTLMLDIQIIFRTVGQLMRADQVSQSGHVTMERFKGNTR